MSVRFVIGRAGTGKTHHCLVAIQNELVRSPVDGPRLVLLVPEQASLQMERALLSGPVQATARAEVLSFRRLAMRVMDAVGGMRRQALSPVARAMVLRRIVTRLAGRLRYYQRVERLTGFFDRLGRTISELIEEDVTAEALRLPDSATEVAAGQRDKLADLADIYAAYLEYLGQDRLDSSQYLQVAREVLPRFPEFHGARLWVDGFAGFSGQELALLGDLAARSASMEVTLLTDPEALSAAEKDNTDDPTDLFARPLRTYRRLRDRLAEVGCSIDPPLILAPQLPPRFQASCELAQLESAFGAIPPRDRARRVRSSAAPSADASVAQGVYYVEASDRRTEVAYAVARVCALTSHPTDPLRYRDVALVCRDLSVYHDLLSAALGERKVPYFIDRRRSLAHHPLVELMRGAGAVVADGASPDTMRLLLKTELLGLDPTDADSLENYVLAHGIAGLPAWSGADWEYPVAKPRHGKMDARDGQRLATINASRRRVIGVLDSLMVLPETSWNGAQWADQLRALLDRAAAAATIEQWALRAESDGEVERAAEHRQALMAVLELLDDLGDALGDESLSAADLAAVLESGLGELTLGLIPPTLDQVLVGSVERSRHPDVKASILLGFNEGVFPASAAEDVVLNDEDRDALANGHVCVGLTRRQRVLDERLLAYVAVTRASHALWVTCALADEAGKPLRPSPYLGDIEAALPDLATQRVVDPALSGETWQVWTGRDLAAALTLEMGRRVQGAAVELPRRVQWNDIYTAARASEDLRSLLAPTLAALVFRNEAELSPGAVTRLISKQYTASVSELESFAACPFQRFAKYGLRLQKRREAELESTDMGTVYHAILESYLAECIERKESFTDISDADVLPRLERCAQRVFQERSDAGEVSTARDSYLLKRSARGLDPIMRSQRRIAAGGRFVPRATEKKYGFAKDEGSLEALELKTPKGHTVRLRGMIDRIDLAELSDELVGVVIDYKRMREKRLDLADVYHGLSLQLLGYLLALAERGQTLAGRPIVPAGAFYVSLLRKYRPVDSPEEAEDIEAPEELVPRGVFDASRIKLLETDAPEAGRAKVFKYYRKKDGELGHIDSTDVATPNQFVGLLAHTRRRLGEFADGVLDGRVEVSPFRLNDFSPCQWCEMRAVCRFEFGDKGLRRLDSLKRSEVLRRVADED